ncbi:MAG TPA: hypothetical protein G4O19_03065 [Dehalococcoidia bacterium]|nr:hypothetical protein [Dehalococcoidia bacterium]
MRRVMKKDSDLESFWLQEMEKPANLSYRLQILLSARKTLPTNIFIVMVNNKKFLDTLDIFDSRLRKWASHGEPPSEDMVKAFGLLLAGRPFEDVKEEVVEEAMLRPTTQNSSSEKEKELTRRKRTVKRAIYRAEDYLKAAGFQVKHGPPLSPEAEQFRKMLKSSTLQLKERPY